MSLLISVKGMSIGTPIATRPGVGGTMSTVAGNGQDGFVSAGVMRVSAWMPSVDARLRRHRSYRAQLQPQRRHRRA
jgi:hypothetical protein